MIDVKRARAQSAFCKDLMNRLDDSIQNDNDEYYGVEKYTVKQNDIVRLRRELMVLSKLLFPWGKT